MLAAEFHYRYIRIHPFDDGNGRTARILMNFILMQYGYPPVIIKTEDKQNYFAALRQADAGLLEPFIEYIADNLNHSLEIMIKGAKGESIEESDDLEKEIALLEQKLKGVGETIEVSRNKEVLWDLYDASIGPLIKQFMEKGALLERFYVESDFHLRRSGVSSGHPGYVIIPTSKEWIDGYTESIELIYTYQGFNRIGLQEVSRESIIHINFDLTRYIISNTNNTIFKKLYGEQLTNNEINELVNSEIRLHTQEIEKRIEEAKNA